jgi:hypothetical protein
LAVAAPVVVALALAKALHDLDQTPPDRGAA